MKLLRASFLSSLGKVWRCLTIGLTLAPVIGIAQPVRIEEMTSVEFQRRIEAGATTVLVPIGGVEQSGPHIVLGKHNVRAVELSSRIARALGNAMVAPVVSYVPEGAIDPPSQHMRFSGTLTIGESTFESLLEDTARSLRQHGVRDVYLLGDHGGYQRNMQRVAEKLNREWKSDSRCRVHALLEYYAATQGLYVQALKSRGYKEIQIGQHAGLADTALSLAVDPVLVRIPLPKAASGHQLPGVSGDPSAATAELGQIGVQAIIDASVAAIRSASPRR